MDRGASAWVRWSRGCVLCVVNEFKWAYAYQYVSLPHHCCCTLGGRVWWTGIPRRSQISDVSTKGFGVVQQSAGRCTELTGGYQGRDLLKVAADALLTFLKVRGNYSGLRRGAADRGGAASLGEVLCASFMLWSRRSTSRGRGGC